MNSLSLDLNEQQLEAVEQMAAHGFQLEEIAEVLMISRVAMHAAFSDRTSDLYRRYRKGYLQSELELRARIFRDAKNGSSPAQTLASKIMADCAYKQNL